MLWSEHLRSLLVRRTASRGDGRAALGRWTARDLVIASGLVALTAGIAVSDAQFAVYQPTLDTAVLAIATVLALGIAALGFARYRERGLGDGLAEVSAFLVLGLASLANLVAVVAGLDRLVGLALFDPGQLPLYVWGAARLVAALLLAAGAVGVVGPRQPGRLRELVLLWGPSVLLAVGAAGLWVVRDRMPVLMDPTALTRLADESFSSAPLPGINAGIFLLDGPAAILLLVAIAAYSRRDRGAAGIPRDYLVAGLGLAVASQVHSILYPAVYTTLVSTAEILRIGAYLVLAAGLQAGARRDLQELHAANARLRLLAAAEADRSAIAERARLARELHDGIAQNLWTASLELDRFATRVDDPGLSPGLERVRDAVQAARAEAQDAVQALRSGFDAGLSLQEELPRRLDAFIARTGFPLELSVDPGVTMHGVAAAEALRVIDEALRNVEKHADATKVRVRIVRGQDGVTIRVEDNGRGFSPSSARGGHGIVGMRERASLLGGTLELRSMAGDGTAVILHLPADHLA